MVVVKTVEEFKKHNDEKLRKFMVFKTGIYDKNEIDDVMQEFYVKLIQTKALSRFDEKEVTHGSIEAVYKVYIVNLFCWLLHYMKKKRDREIRPQVSWVPASENDSKSHIDVFEYVTSSDICSDYQIDSSFYHSSHHIDREEKLGSEIEDFKRFILKTESKKKAQKLIRFIDGRTNGCKHIDIAHMLGVSNNMVKFIKIDAHNSYKRYESEWKKAIKYRKQ